MHSTQSWTTDALLPRLKRDTQASHSALESRIDWIHGLQTFAGYKKILEAFYGVIAPIEARLAEHQADLAVWLPDIQDRMRTGALRRDLQVLGNSSPQDLPTAAVPDYPSPADRFGCLYVLEGSTLGGQFIARQVQRALGLPPEQGCAFFYGHGSATGEMWQRFREALETYASARPSEHSAVILAAARTFQIFDSWMSLRL